MTHKRQATRIDALVEGDAAVDEATYTASDALSYIQEMIGALRDMAESGDQLLLAYLLDMAHEEARLQSSLRVMREQERAAERA